MPTIPSRKPKSFSYRLNMFYTTYSLNHRTSVYFPDTVVVEPDWTTVATSFANALASLMSITDCVIYGYSVTHSNNFSQPEVPFAAPIPGTFATDTGIPMYKSFTLALPGRGIETNVSYKPSPAKISFFPGRIGYVNPSRLYIYPSELPAVHTFKQTIQALNISTVSSQLVQWYDRVAVQFNAHTQRKVGA